MKMVLFIGVLILISAASAQVSWQKIGQSNNLPEYILDVDGRGQIKYAVGHSYWARLSRSTDNGVTWSQNSYSGQSVYAVDHDDNSDNVVCVGDNGNLTKPVIWRSSDAGETWANNVDSSLGSERFFDVVMLSSNLVVVAAKTGVYKSQDFAQTWVKKFSLGQNELMTRVCRLANGNLLAGKEAMNSTGWKIYLSSDQGENWQMVDGVNSGNYGHYGFVQTENGTIYAQIWSASGNFFRRSSDNGQTWSQVSTGNFAGGSKQGTPRFTSYQNHLYVEEGARGLSASFNNGASWHWNFKLINCVAGNGNNGMILFEAGSGGKTNGAIWASVNPSAIHVENSPTLGTNISMGATGIGINLVSGSLSSLTAEKYSVVAPLAQTYDEALSEHYLIRAEPPTNTYNATISVSYNPNGIGNQRALQVMRYEPPKSSNNWQGKWVYLMTTIDSVNHKATASGISEFPIWLTLRKNSPVLVVADSLPFGKVRVGQSRDKILWIKNTGQGTLTVTNKSLSGPDAYDFSIISGGGVPFTVAAGDSHQMVLRFTSQSSLGLKSALLSFVHNGACSVCATLLTATVSLPLLQLSATNLDFGIVDVGQTKDTLLAVKNIGNDTLKVTGYTITNQFSLANNAPPFNVLPNDSVVITVRFSPQSPNGLRSGTLELVHNAPRSPSIVRLNGEAVPVELVSFTAEVADEEIILRWQTATETNNAGFYIEQSVIAIRQPTEKQSLWQTLGFVKGAGTTNQQQFYEFVLPKTFGTYKFRLRQIDLDGTISFSRENEIVIQPKEFKVSQNYPNPFNPSTTIKIDVPVAGELKCEVFNVLGQRMKSEREMISEAGMFEFVLTPQNWASGKYFLRATFQNKSQLVKIFHQK